MITANISPLIPNQFPTIYKEDGPNFINFIQAYYAWMEEANNVTYYARNMTQIRDIDDTFEQFIVYFKDKYLKNIKFTTAADIRMVIKHALDIYRSKGTERCARLIFQLAFGDTPSFYYPSTDLFKLSDGQWVIPQYLELDLHWENNIQLQNQEIQGAFSGAIGFVDQVIRTFVNNRLVDVAYISAVQGFFRHGEKVFPTNTAVLPFPSKWPTVTGSLTSISISSFGTGFNYAVGDVINISSQNGNGATILVTGTANQSGTVSTQFIDGGWGYMYGPYQTTINFTSNTGAFTNGTNIYTWKSGAQTGAGLITSVNSTAINILNLSGNVANNANAIYTNANAISANISSLLSVNVTPTVWVSQTTITLANIQFLSSNLEYTNYFGWQDVLTQPLGTVNYVNATGTPVVGMNVYTWSAGSITGNGVIISANPANTTTGVITVSVLGGNLQNTLYTTSNVITMNLASLNGYTNSTATGMVIANATSIVLNVNNINGVFVAGEEIFQDYPIPYPQLAQKTGGWGIISVVNTSSLTISNVYGKFNQNDPLSAIIGGTTGATANVVSSIIQIGVANTNNNQFIASNYAYCSTNLITGIVNGAFVAGNSFSIQVTSNLEYTQTISFNTDVLSKYSSVAMNAATYGFPAAPSGNATNLTMAAQLNMVQNVVVGKLGSVVLTGLGQNFSAPPYIVIENPYIDTYDLFDDVISFTGATGSFVVGEEITQSATGAQGIVNAYSNSTVLYLQRMTFANDFVVTSNSTTTIIGTQSGATANATHVDYNLTSQPMGRNTTIETFFGAANNLITNVAIISSGLGFVNGETVSIGTNTATGTVVLSMQGIGQGYYNTTGGFLSDRKKLFDGYFYQNFSYQIVSQEMVSQYYSMIQELTHVSGTIMFGNFVHNSVTNSAPTIQNAVVTT